MRVVSSELSKIKHTIYSKAFPQYLASQGAPLFSPLGVYVFQSWNKAYCLQQPKTKQKPSRFVGNASITLYIAGPFRIQYPCFLILTVGIIFRVTNGAKARRDSRREQTKNSSTLLRNGHIIIYASGTQFKIIDHLVKNYQ